MEPRRLLNIFGWGSDRVGPITALEQNMRRREGTINPGSTPVDDILPKTDICWGSLVGAGVGSGYLDGIDVS